jgi:uncharacterized protein YbbC (DUF1343 family)
LDVLLADAAALRGKRVGVACNHTAVNRNRDHLVPLLRAEGVAVARLFTPEHGLHATAQDMIAVEGSDADRAVVSLYGKTAASLRPDPALLSDLDVLLFDIQDIGARYYTYQATLGYILEASVGTGCKVVVLDRPNPIDGVTLEGNVVRPGFQSFVGAYPLAVRHGLTMGELGLYFREIVGVRAELDVVRSEGWDRGAYLDETDAPWVYPSPNMPTIETAILYPGMCLLEGTNVSEGRGTTRPFHLFGAPWFDAEELCRLCRLGSMDAKLEGAQFRAASFEPRFQKFAGQVCHGVEVTVSDRRALDSFLLGLVVLEACIRARPQHFRWRTETYEFVDSPIAIDLLCGNAEARLGLEARVRPRELLEGWRAEVEGFAERREGVLRY